MRGILYKLGARMSRGRVLSGRNGITRRFGTGHFGFEKGGQSALRPFGGGGRFFFGGEGHLAFFGVTSPQIRVFGVHLFVCVGASRDDGVVGDFALGVDGGGEDVAFDDSAGEMGVAHVSWILRHVDLGEGAPIVKVGGGAGHK